MKVPRLKDCKGLRVWSFVRGLAANISEAQWSEFSNTTYDRPQVCPVLKSWFGGLINVYPRAVVASESGLDDLYDDLEFKTPTDVHIGNLGYWNGHFVWLDYDMNWNDCKRCGIDVEYVHPETL